MGNLLSELSVIKAALVDMMFLSGSHIIIVK